MDEVRPLIGGIPVASVPTCAGHEAHLAYWKHRTITQEEYFNQGAILTAEHANLYKPAIYPPIPHECLSYAKGRTSEGRQYDHASAKRLGDWFFSLIKAHEANVSDLEQLVWARDRLARISLAPAMLRVEEAIERYSLNPFPQDHANLTMWTKKLDAVVRERRGA